MGDRLVCRDRYVSFWLERFRGPVLSGRRIVSVAGLVDEGPLVAFDAPDGGIGSAETEAEVG
jgi:hypothetical protein